MSKRFYVYDLSCRTICTVLVLILFSLAASSYKANGEELLGIQAFYGKGNPYSAILKDVTAKPVDKKYETVQPYTGPYFGWKTNGQPAMSPTKVAADGFTYILNGRIEAAKAHANWLIEHAIYQHDTMFFPFDFDYAPLWPYDLKAPWYSALTQGVALSLCVYLYRETHEQQYLDWAHTIYKSLLVPIEKGGVTRFEDDGPFFEEYPTQIPSRVLNGAAVAMIAVHDYAKVAGNTEAMALFRQSVKRLETLLPEYETQVEGGIVGSYYSLTPSRTDILGRFKGTAHLFVTDMNVYGYRGDNKTLLVSVDVGSKNDHDVMRDFYVWPDQAYMNWGPPRVAVAISGREVNGRRGKYDHSPFKFFVSTHEPYEAYSIEVAWTGLPEANQKLSAGRENSVLNLADQKLQDWIDVQFYDGQAYWKVGTIHALKAGEEKRAEFLFPKDFYGKWLLQNESKPKIDERYLDDNQLLVQLIADLADSQIARTYANNWKASLDLVPAQWFNEFPPSLFAYTHPKPVIAIVEKSDESVHAEYPSVIKINGTFHMYYCAYGDSLRWKLFHATSTDGREWRRQDEVFDKDSLPPDLQGNIAFPHVIRDAASPQGYLLYFSAAPERGKPYEKIHYADSKDGVKWRYQGVAVDGNGLDPLVVISPERQYQMYYTKVHSGKVSIMHTVSVDGREFSAPVAALTFTSGRRGLYTLSGFYVDQRLLLFLESSTPIGRHDTLLWIREGERFEPFDRNPLMIDQDWISRWDARRYGFNFVSHGDKTLLYYNGIPSRGAEKGGQIGMAEFNLAMLKRMIAP